MKICTIIARNYIPQARVLAESLKRHHPDKTLQVLVFDHMEGPLYEGREPFEIVTPADLDLSRKKFHQMATIYDVMELATALKPWLLKHLFDQGANVAVYLDPDIEIHDSLRELEDLAGEHGVVLTPHIIDPVPRDDRFPRETDILLAGIYNLGFIAVGRRGDNFLDWWQERLVCDGISSVSEGYFVDQRWVDFLPGLFEHYILRDPGYNVAYWNLSTRKITKNNGRYLVNGEPLRFFHFSGYSPDAPYLLSKHQQDKPRTLLSDNPFLEELCSNYRSRLLKAGFGKHVKHLYGFTYTDDGLKITPEIRRLCRDYIVNKNNGNGESSDFPDPFDQEESEAFTRWLNEPSPSSPNRRISRFIQYIYDRRHDLQIAFPEIYGPDADQFLHWVRNYAPSQYEYPYQLLPGEPIQQPEKETVSTSINTEPGINIAGYFKTESGVGEAGRSLVSVLEQSDIPYCIIPPFKLTISRQDHSLDESRIDDPRYDVNIICINADQLPMFIENAGRDLLDDRYTIGLWAWELEEMPEKMIRRAVELVDEVWAYSRHAAEAISRVIDKPVYYCPLPVVASDAAQLSRKDLGLPEGFMFLFCFDFLSIMERKNPLALIEAFKTAFAAGEGPVLVIKTINGDHQLLNLERLRAAAAGRPDIFVIDGYFSRDEQLALMNQCDAYVSLHRAEGYGLTMAEAMSLGKPVIATGYSGNLEFMNHENSFLVPYTKTQVPEGCQPYPAGYFWAEPDVAAAARLIREVYEHPERAAEVASRARRDIMDHHSPKARVDFMQERYEAIRGLRNAPVSPVMTEENAIQDDSVVSGKQLAASYLAGNPDPGAPSRFGWLSKSIRRLVFRMLRNYDVYQRQTGHALLQAVTESDAQREAELSVIAMSTAELNNRLLQVESATARLRVLEENSLNLTAAFEMMSDRLARVADGLKMLDLKSDDVAASQKMRLEMLQDEIRNLTDSITATPYMSDPREFEIAGNESQKALGYQGMNKDADVPFYVRFENIFRGNEEFIRERQKVYMESLSGHEPVVDAGCGRGEMLDLLSQAEIPAIGVDMDEGMIGHCREKGLAVEHADINEFLNNNEDGTVGAIFSAQVIEHMSLEQIMDFIRLAHAKLKPGGILIAETVNPHSTAALKNFWVDLSHQRPVFPETAITLCRHFGFEKATVMFPNGNGDFQNDLTTQGEYAVVAVKATLPVRESSYDSQDQVFLGSTQ